MIRNFPNSSEPTPTQTLASLTPLLSFPPTFASLPKNSYWFIAPSLPSSPSIHYFPSSIRNPTSTVPFLQPLAFADTLVSSLLHTSTQTLLHSTSLTLVSLLLNTHTHSNTTLSCIFHFHTFSCYLLISNTPTQTLLYSISVDLHYCSSTPTPMITLPSPTLFHTLTNASLSLLSFV